MLWPGVLLASHLRTRWHDSLPLLLLSAGRGRMQRIFQEIFRPRAQGGRQSGGAVGAGEEGQDRGRGRAEGGGAAAEEGGAEEGEAAAGQKREGSRREGQGDEHGERGVGQYHSPWTPSSRTGLTASQQQQQQQQQMPMQPQQQGPRRGTCSHSCRGRGSSAQQGMRRPQQMAQQVAPGPPQPPSSRACP